MPSIKKARVEEIKREAEIASEKQMNDIYAAISGLGSNTASQSRKTEPEPEAPAPEIKTVTKPAAAEVAPVVTTSEPESKDDKPGYVSLVIPNSLKKKWKMYSTVHGMSLTDCLKLGMKLLEEMEQKGTIRIEEGFLTINA